jgi:hypothetical protein
MNWKLLVCSWAWISVIYELSRCSWSSKHWLSILHLSSQIFSTVISTWTWKLPLLVHLNIFDVYLWRSWDRVSVGCFCEMNGSIFIRSWSVFWDSTELSSGRAKSCSTSRPWWPFLSSYASRNLVRTWPWSIYFPWSKMILISKTRIESTSKREDWGTFGYLSIVLARSESIIFLCKVFSSLLYLFML